MGDGDVDSSAARESSLKESSSFGVMLVGDGGDDSSAA